MARTVYVTTELTGGGSGLDGINGNSLVKGDMAFYINPDSTKAPKQTGNLFGVYVATTDNKSESSPNIIEPDSNPGDWNWNLMSPLMAVFHTTGMASTLPNHGINVIRSSGATVHMLQRPRRGTHTKLLFATTSVVKVRLTTAPTGYLVKLDGCGHPSITKGSSICVIINPTSRSITGGSATPFPVGIELAGRTTSRWEILNIISMSTGGNTPKKRFTYSSST